MRTTGGQEWWGLYKHMTPRSVETYMTTAIEDVAITCKPHNEELPWLFAG